MRKRVALILSVLMIIMTPIQALGQTNQILDMPNDWSTQALENAVSNGLLLGYEGKIHPEKNLKRSEMATIINRAFGSVTKAPLDAYGDVNEDSWYYDEMAKAVAMKSFQGSGSRLNPEDPITREEAFLVISRVLHLKENEATIEFNDLDQISSWAKEGIYGLINKGLINGYSNKINPKGFITRAEFAQLMDNIIKHYITTPGSYDSVPEGNVLINSPGVTLKNLTVYGDLILAEGIGEGEVILDNVKVEGRVLVRAGGENSIIIKGDSDINSIVIIKQGNIVRVFNETGKEIAVATVEGTADVILEGSFKNVVVQSPDITVYAQGTTIESAEINGARSRVIVDDNSMIGNALVRGSNVIIEGSGEVERVEVKSGGTGTKITTPDTIIDVEDGANNVQGTNGIAIEKEQTYVNGSTLSEDAKPYEPTTPPDPEYDYTPPVTTYTVTYSVIGNNGTLSATRASGSSVNSGTSVTFTATPSDGYEIKEWKVNGTAVESGNILIRTISANTTVSVEFQLIPAQYSIDFGFEGQGGISSTASFGQMVDEGTEVFFRATPLEGYRLKEWRVNDIVQVHTNLEFTIAIIGNTYVEAIFEAIPPTMYTVNFSTVGSMGNLYASVEGIGHIYDGNQVAEGTDVTFTADIPSGYEIKEWKVNNEVVEAGSTLTTTITAYTMVSIEFQTIVVEPTTYTLTYSVVGEGGELSTSYVSGTSVPINSVILMTATPDEGYRVKGWTFNSQPIVSTNTVYSFTMTRDNVITVEFEEIPDGIYTVNFSTIDGIGSITANADGIGAISNGAEVPDGYDIIFTAEIPDGYRIKEWSVNGEIFYPYGNENTFTVYYIWADMNVTVEFEEIPVVTHEILIFVENVDGATVEVKDAENTVIPVTKIQGKNYFYDLEVGSYTYTVSKDGYYTVERALEVTETDTEYVTMVEVLPGIVSVIDPPIIELNVGQDLPILPSTVDVVLDTDAVVTLGVTWNTDGFDKNSPENYVLGGTLTLTDGVENPLGLVALQLVDVFASPEITLDITNSNILRFDFDAPIVWVGEKDITEIGTPDYTTLAFLQDLFSDPTLDASVLNEENIEIVYGVGYLQINLLEDAINRDLFLELDHPWGLYGGNGDGVYRKDVAVDLSIFNNHLGLASESTAEPFKLKFTVPYEYGLPNYEGVISGVWQTAEQRATEIDPVRTMPTYEVIFTDTNVLRIESNQPIYFQGNLMWAGVDKALLLAQLFGKGENFRNVEELFDLDKVVITSEDTAFEIHLLSGVFDSEFFWNIDHPNGIDPDIDGNPYPLDKDGNGVYRKHNTINLNIFYNSSWDSVEETIDSYLKLYVQFENGIGKYNEPVQAVWQSVDQRNADIVNDPVMDTTPPVLIGITPMEGTYFVDRDEIIEIVITTQDDNIYRISPFESTWYYAMEDVYNGDEDSRSFDLEAGVIVTYEGNGVWRFNLGEELSANIPVISFMIDIEDYAGNKLTDITDENERVPYFISFERLDYGPIERAIEYVENLFTVNHYTEESRINFWIVYDDILENMPETTQDEIENKKDAIYEAAELLVLFIEVTQVEIDETYDIIIVGEIYNLTTTVLPVDATNKNIIWSIVSGPGQIDHTGELIANGEGLIVVRATSESYFMVWDELAFTAVLTPPNELPVPYEGTVNVKSGSTILIDVVANSFDADGDTLSITEFTQGANGTVTQEGDSIRYTPNLGFIGTDQFTYTISDGVDEVEGTIDIVVDPAGNQLTDGSYGGNRIGIYQNGSNLEAVLLDVTSTTALLLDTGTVSPVGIEENAGSIYFIYMLNGEVVTAKLIVDGLQVVEADRWIITSLNVGGAGTLNTIKYVVDNDEVIHFAYRDTHATADDYRNDDIMYYNTVNMSRVLIATGYRDYSSSGSWAADYVHIKPHDIAIDINNNPVIVYHRQNVWRWSNGTDNTYFVHLSNPMTLQNVTVESSYGSDIYSNLELTSGASTIGLKYDRSGVTINGYITADPLSVDVPSIK